MTSIESLADALFLMVKTVCPIFLVFGTFGNVMIVIIFLRFKDHSPLSIYFIALAISDVLQLYYGLTMQYWLDVQFSISFVCVHMIFCKLGTAVKYMCSALSSWYLAVMTMQRAMSVVWPHLVNVICTRNVSCAVTAVMTVVLTTFYSHLMYGFSVVQHHNSSFSVFRCECIDSDYEYFFDHIFSTIDLIAASVAPFVLLLLSNSVLVRAVLASAKTLRYRLAAGQSMHVTARESKAYSLSVTLIVVSITFLVLTAPVRVQRVTNPYVYYKSNAINKSINMLVLHVLNILCGANSVVNFYLYCLTGAKFRRAVLHFLCLST